MTETKKRNIAQLRNERNLKCIEVCALLNIRFAYFGNGQAARLNKGGKVIDYYAKGNKVFSHESQEWGEVKDIEAFLRYEYA